MTKGKNRATLPVIILISVVFAVVIIFLVGLIFGFRYASLPSGVKFLGRMRGGEPVKGTAYYETGKAKYNKETKTLSYSGGNVYVGDVKDLLPDGQGRLEYASGDVYEGSFVRGLRDGQGTILYVSGDTYAGEWKNDKGGPRGLYLRRRLQLHRVLFRE